MIDRTIGRYRVTALLGKGGMGEVWRAEDTLLGRPVALKFLPETAGPEDRERFLRGLRAVAGLSHPGIAQVHEAGEHEGRPYAVLAFIDGETVAELLARGPVAVPEALRITIAAAEALGHAHDHGVLHRDVKSSNIMVARDGRVYVVDCGLAWRTDLPRITRSTAIIGTVSYMAPEVARGMSLDRRSDLYSLGIVLYELLTGTTPLAAIAGEAWFHHLLNEPVSPPGTHRAGLPASLDELVLRLLDKDAERRFQNAAELAAALAAVARGEWVAAPGRSPSPTGNVIPHRLPEHKYIAVHPFGATSASGDGDGRLEALASGLAEALSVGLGRLPGVRVFPPSMSGREDPASSPASAAARTGANLAIGGTLRREGGALHLRWWLIQPATGIQLAAGSIAGAMVTIADLEERLVGEVADALGLGGDSRMRTRPIERDPVAHERYLQALGYLRRYENEAAVDGSIGILERLASGDGDTAAYPAALGRAFLHKHQITSNTMWLHRAAAACERAITLDDGAAEVLLTLGEIRSATGQYGEAGIAYRRVLDLRPEDLDAWVGLSRALEGERRLGEAEDAARRAVALRPDHWPAYNRLGVLFFHQSRYERAVEAWCEVTRLTPDNPRGWYNLGAAYFRSDRLDDALAAYRRSLEIRPSARAYSGEGSVLFYSGRIEESVERFEKARALTPEDPLAWGDLGSALMRLEGREAEAKRHLERAVAMMRQRVELNPRDPDGFSLLGNWLAHLGRLDEARAHVAQALALEPEDGAHMIRAAYVAALLGERDVAIAWLRAARARGYGEVAIRSDPVLGPLVEAFDEVPVNGGAATPREAPAMGVQSDPGGAP